MAVPPRITVTHAAVQHSVLPPTCALAIQLKLKADLCTGVRCLRHGECDSCCTCTQASDAAYHNMCLLAVRHGRSRSAWAQHAVCMLLRMAPGPGIEDVAVVLKLMCLHKGARLRF